MQDVTVKVPYIVTRTMIEDLLCGAFEGGSNHWAITGVTKEDRDKVGA